MDQSKGTNLAIRLKKKKRRVHLKRPVTFGDLHSLQRDGKAFQGQGAYSGKLLCPSDTSTRLIPPGAGEAVVINHVLV